MSETNPTFRGTSVMPSLTVNNLQETQKLFEALGFEVEERWEKDGELLGLMLKAGDVHLGLNQDDWKKGRDRVKGVGISLYIEVDGDVDQIAARAKAAGAELKSEPKDTGWGGSRSFEIAEPTGFAITIISKPK